MSARSKARKRALDLLYAAELRSRPVSEELDQMRAEGTAINDYTVALVQGIDNERGRLDEAISRHSRGWALDRMPAVDRNVLRLGAYEVLYVVEVPDGVAISEAVHLARELSTDDSPSFVNGVLGNIAREKG